jgi:hypothetical protein
LGLPGSLQELLRSDLREEAARPLAISYRTVKDE